MELARRASCSALGEHRGPRQAAETETAEGSQALAAVEASPEKHPGLRRRSKLGVEGLEEHLAQEALTKRRLSQSAEEETARARRASLKKPGLEMLTESTRPDSRFQASV